MELASSYERFGASITLKAENPCLGRTNYKHRAWGSDGLVHLAEEQLVQLGLLGQDDVLQVDLGLVQQKEVEQLAQLLLKSGVKIRQSAHRIQL